MDKHTLTNRTCLGSGFFSFVHLSIFTKNVNSDRSQVKQILCYFDFGYPPGEGNNLTTPPNGKVTEKRVYLFKTIMI
jgi:hypothetical protein